MEPQIEIVTPEVQKETETALSIINSANALIIQNVTDYKYAQVTMREVKDRIKELTDIRMAQTRPIDESKARIIAFFYEGKRKDGSKKKPERGRKKKRFRRPWKPRQPGRSKKLSRSWPNQFGHLLLKLIRKCLNQKIPTWLNDGMPKALILWKR